MDARDYLKIIETGRLPEREVEIEDRLYQAMVEMNALRARLAHKIK